MSAIFSVSVLSVLKVFLVCAAGVWLARTGIMDRAFRQALSRVLMLLLLPCLLITNLAASANLTNLLRWTVLPLVSILYVVVGMALGYLIVLLFRPPAEQRRAVVAATAFGNSGYMPIPLILAIAATAPLFRGDPGAGERGIAYISVYLVTQSPLLWGVAFPYLANRPFGHLRLRQVLSAPVISVLAGIVIGVTPPLRAMLVPVGAPLRVLMDSATLLGAAAIPCALLILGANLADAQADEARIAPRTVVAVCVGRLVLMPLLGCGLALALRRGALLPADPMFILVVMLQAAVPPANNLLVMCQVHDRAVGTMAKLLFWSYLVAIFSLTGFVALFLWLAGNM